MVILRLGEWSPHVQAEFHVFRPTQGLDIDWTCTGLSPTMASLSKLFQLSIPSHWPGPLSLATTQGVSVDFLSSGYLDVSVPRVRLYTLYIQMQIPHKRWVFPFGHPGIKAFWQLHRASRSLTREILLEHGETTLQA